MVCAAQRILLAIACVLIAVDAVWATGGHFDIETWPYQVAALLVAGLLAGGTYYEKVRGEEALAAMLFGAAFLLTFSASCSLLNYMTLTVAGPRIDTLLAAADRTIGVDWPALMAWAAHHPRMNYILWILYNSVLPQIVLLIALLGWREKPFEIYRLCLAIALGALITVAFWTLFPSFGAFSVYELPTAVKSHLAVALNETYAKDLIRLLADGPGRIVPTDIKGLVGFPSFHAVQALLVVWFARNLKGFRIAAVVVNVGVLLATPIQGGHHVIDVAGGFAVAAAAVAASRFLIGAVARMQAPSRRGAVPLASEMPKFYRKIG